MLPLLAQQPTAAPTPFWESDAVGVLGIWVAVGFTLALYTFLYKDNAVFKFAEHVYVGVTNGYLLWQAWLQSVKPELVLPFGRLLHIEKAGPLQPGDSWWLLVPAAFAVFMLLRFHPKSAWLSRWSFAFIVGITAGTLIPLTIKAQLFQQISKMLESPIAREGGRISVSGTVNAILLLIGVLTVLVYFIFSVEHKGAIRKTAKTGIVFLMIAFGAHFGYTVMGRESLLIQRVQFLLKNSRAESSAEEVDEEGKKPPNPYRATLVLFPAIVLAVAALEFTRSRKPASEPAAPPPAG